MTITLHGPTVASDVPAEERSGFDLGAYLTTLPPRLLEHPRGRAELTRMDPLAFALLYLPHHLKGDATDHRITLNEFHLDLIEHAKTWPAPLGEMKAHRDAYVAPRECGKSTWNFLILPLWAAAHGHLKFIAAFADSASQAEAHLQTFKTELDTNLLLRQDFPDLCEPARRTRVARQLADNRGQIHQANGFIFMARGVDSAALGMKVGSLRPQLILLDDIEPGESNYSPTLAKKRLATLQDVIFPLNLYARVVLVGTVTMRGSIVHQLVESVGSSDPAPWVEDENFRVNYYPAIRTLEDGREVSLWPEKWPLELLQSMRHTRSFMKNFMNQPVSEDGDYWSPEDFIHCEGHYGNTLLSIDPAVTSKKTSDETGLVVVSRSGKTSAGYDQVTVREAFGVRQSGKDLKATVTRLLNQYPDIGLLYVETNQGGDLVRDLFADLPVKVRTVHQSQSKEVRAGKALNFYQRRQVAHAKALPALEEQMLGFPTLLHDDVLDAAVSGVNYFLDSNQTPAMGTAKQKSYL